MGYRKIDWSFWGNHDSDNSYYEIGNCYKTEEEAEKARDIRIIDTELRRYAEEHNEHELDWENENMSKYSIGYNYYDKKLDIYANYCIKSPSQIYFSSEEIVEEAIKAIGEYRVKLWAKGE